MAGVIVSVLVSRLLEYMGQSAFKNIVPCFGGSDKLHKLRWMMTMIQARLADAERQREGATSALVKEWLTLLRGVLYKLEDLFEEVAFDEKQKEEMDDGGWPIKRICTLLRDSNTNKRVSEEVDLIMKEFEDITSLMHSLDFKECPSEQQGPLVMKRSRETHSFIVEEEVLGREEEKKAIVEMLLNTNDGEENVCVIPIVGIGGLGKTALAQLCYNDKAVQQHFEVNGWACISENSTLHSAAGEILKSLGHGGCQQMSFEEIQSRLRGVLNDKKYLLVLDDVWDDDRDNWLKLRNLLSEGKRGSRIIVTSRSKIVAQNMGTVKAHELRGLEEDKSLALFKRLAFGEGQEENNPNFTSIGREIVKKCAGVPLAIRTIAGLLYSRDTEQEWESFKDQDLRSIGQHENNPNAIMMTLKLSFDYLPSPLKQCFAYCSLYPKDYVYDIEELILLWMAQGYIRPVGDQNLEDVGHAYFMELLRRCFFQDVSIGKCGRIAECKMHDLLHDLACEVGDECLLVDDESIKQIEDSTRHLSFFDVGSPWSAPSWMLAGQHIRSLLYKDYWSPLFVPNFDEIFSSMRCLRALDFASGVTERLPNSIGELKHLRYLNLGQCSKPLPDSIVRLQNLQILLLDWSEYLGELPPKFGELTSLRRLGAFAVGENNGVDALASMNLTGALKIYFKKHRQDGVSEAKAADLKGKKLFSLTLDWYAFPNAEAGGDADEELEWLQPPPTLQELEVEYWKGVRLPSWGMNELPCRLLNLVDIKIHCCARCNHLPPLSRLPLLKSLELNCLESLEYIENSSSEAASSSSSSYFPSLDSLTMVELPRLKRWSRNEEDVDQSPQQVHQHQPQPMFPRLSELYIHTCSKLLSMPVAPRLKSLHASSVDGKLLHQLARNSEDLAAVRRGVATFSSSSSTHFSELKKLEVGEVHGVDTLSINCFPSLESLNVDSNRELIKLTAESPTPLRRLEIWRCSRLKDIRGALEQLSFLEDLDIDDCEELELSESDVKEDNEGEGSTSKSAWQGLKSLRTLRLSEIPKVETLFPRGLGCLTTLHSLEITHLPNLRALPESIGNLANLRKLTIWKCSRLTSLTESIGNLANLGELTIMNCAHLTSLPESISNLANLRQLEISTCSHLTSLPESIGNLANLRQLEIKACSHLTSLPESIGNLANLRELKIWECSRLTSLPESIGNLTNLRELEILLCSQLTSLPASFRNLTALQLLSIRFCPDLVRRCEEPHGEDWPLIQPIPNITVHC